MKTRYLWQGIAAVAVLATGSLAVAGMRLAWHWSGQTTVLPLAVPAPPDTASPAQQPDLTAILALAPFGQANRVVTAVRSAADAPRLDVVLRGIMANPDPAQSRALVRAGGTTAVLRIGEQVQNAELVAIATATITLQTGTARVVIGFDGQQGDATPDARDRTEAPPAAPPAETDPLARLAASIVAGNGSIDLRDGPPPETTDDYIAFWRDRITRNPQAVLDSIGIERVDNGYRIAAAPDIGVTMAGLRPGDVVTKLNGQAVGNIDRDRQLYDEVAASGMARLDVVRDGKPLVLSFPLR